MTFKLSRQDASLSQDVGCTNYYLLIGISSCFLHSLLLPIFKFVLFRFCRNFTCGFVYNDMSKETTCCCRNYLLSQDLEKRLVRHLRREIH